MKNEKIVKYADIGTVLYRKNKRARNISIRISAEGEVKVTIPRLSTFKTAENFVLKKHPWIKKKLRSIERKNEGKLALGIGSILATPEGRIYIEQGKAEGYMLRQSQRDYQLFVPRDFIDGDDESIRMLKNKLGKLGLQEAKVLLPAYLESISAQVGLRYAKVGIRRMKSRWGSCSPANNINLNSALVYLPYRLIEYVLLHELVHTKHKNHSKAFWDALEGYMPDAKQRRKELHDQTMII